MLVLSLGAGRAPEEPTIRLALQDAPVEEGLRAIAGQTGVDLVYAARVVEGRRTSCRYEGELVEEALACVLAPAGLRAERVRWRQYVVVAAPLPAEEAPPPAPPRASLAGFVADAETGELLPGAHVWLAALQVGTVTNDAGYFVLPGLPEGRYAVRVSYLGYRPADTTLVAASAAEAMVVRLVPATFEAAGVVVEADPDDPERTLTLPGALAVPPRRMEQLPTFSGEQDLFQALSWLPGVRRVGEIGQGLSVRGSDPSQNLYLLDGAPVYHPWHVFSLISTFQTETLKDVRLYRGAFPAEYGGRLSAVLDAQLRDGDRRGPKAVAGLGLLSGRALVEVPVTRAVSFMVSGRRSYLDQLLGRRHPVEKDGRRDTLRTGYFFYDASAKLSVRPSPRHRLSLSLYQGRDDLDLRLPFDLSLDPASWLREPPDLFFEIDHRWGNRLASARYQYLFSRRLFATATAYYSDYRGREAALLRPTSSARVASAYDVALRDLGARLDVDYYHSLAHQVRTGVQVVDRRFESRLDARVQRSPGAVDTLAQQSRSAAVEVVAYVQDVWQPVPRLLVQPGLRASLFSNGAHTHLSPRLSVQYAVDPERFVLRGAVGTQVQYLQQLRDRYSFLYDLVSQRWVPVGRGLAPSTTRQAALGAEVYPLPGLTLALDAYGNDARHVLVPRDQYQSKEGLEGPGIEVGSLLGQYVEGEGRTYGVEASLRVEEGPWQIWLSYTGGRSLGRAPALGEGRFRPTRFDVPRAFSGVVSRVGRHWNVAIATELRSGFPTTVPVARYALGDPLAEAPVRYLARPQVNNGRLPPYLRFDATLGYRFRWLGARWRSQLHLYNVTGRRNVVGQTYDPARPVVEADDRLGLPLIPFLEFELEL